MGKFGLDGHLTKSIDYILLIKIKFNQKFVSYLVNVGVVFGLLLGIIFISDTTHQLFFIGFYWTIHHLLGNGINLLSFNLQLNTAEKFLV